MKQKPLSVEQIVLMDDVWRFIQCYFDLPYNDVMKLSYSYKAGEYGETHYLHIERVNAKESISMPYQESDRFAIALLQKFGLDWRPVNFLTFEVEPDGVPIFDMGVYPHIRPDKGGE